MGGGWELARVLQWGRMGGTRMGAGGPWYPQLPSASPIRHRSRASRSAKSAGFRDRQSLTEAATQTPTICEEPRAPTHTPTQSAGPRHKERRAPKTQRWASARPRHKEGAPGPDTKRRAPTQKGRPDTKSAGRGPPGPEDGRSSTKAVLLEKENPAPCRRPLFQYKSFTIREGKSSRLPATVVPVLLV